VVVPDERRRRLLSSAAGKWLSVYGGKYVQGHGARPKVSTTAAAVAAGLCYRMPDATAITATHVLNAAEEGRAGTVPASSCHQLSCCSWVHVSSIGILCNLHAASQCTCFLAAYLLSFPCLALTAALLPLPSLPLRLSTLRLSCWWVAPQVPLGGHCLPWCCCCVGCGSTFTCTAWAGCWQSPSRPCTHCATHCW
jgi:hypothetical protein